jgi:superfamily II DNA or RNA helicase
MAVRERFIVKQQPLMTGAVATYPMSASLQSRFQTVSRFGEPICMWSPSPDGQHIRVPRGVCPIGLEDRRIKGTPISIKSRVVPRNDEQARVLAETKALLKAGESFIIEASTGFGKTVIAWDVIATMGVKTLVVGTKDDLYTQWAREGLKHTDIQRSRLGFVRQDAFDVTDKDVVVGMLHSLAIQDRYPAWLRNEFGLIVFDEVHRLGAETFSRVASMFTAALRLGMSATPERQDGKEIIFYCHIGPVKVRAKLIKLSPKILVYKSPWKCPVVPTDVVSGVTVLKKMPHEPGKCGHILKRLVKSKTRNELCAMLCHAAWRKDRNAVFFSDIIAHLQQVYAMANALGVPQSDMAYYTGAQSKKEKDIAKGKKLVFATYAAAGEGTDVPWWDCGILGAPRAHVKQIIGRFLREYPDKKQPVIVDIRDDDSPVYAAYARSRVAVYEDAEIGGEIVHMN